MTDTEQKIVNGIKYFVKNTKHVGRTKLFKLLFFWDFLTFKKYAKSITGYDYYTFQFGPVPKKLFDEIIENNLPKFLEENIAIVKKEDDEGYNNYPSFDVRILSKRINLDSLSQNEKKTLEEVAFIYKDTLAKDMTEISHLPNSPWRTTVEKEGYGKKIDYLLALDNESPFTPEEAKERLELQKELLADGRI